MCPPLLLDAMCAVLSNGTAVCWGSFAALADHPSMTQPYPMFVVSTPANMTVVTVATEPPQHRGGGPVFSVYLTLSGGTLLEWIITPVWGPSGSPISVTSHFTVEPFADTAASDTLTPFTEVSAQNRFVCGLTEVQTVSCRFRGGTPVSGAPQSPFLGKQYRKVVSIASVSEISAGCACGKFVLMQRMVSKAFSY